MTRTPPRNVEAPRTGAGARSFDCARRDPYQSVLVRVIRGDSLDGQSDPGRGGSARHALAAEQHRDAEAEARGFDALGGGDVGELVLHPRVAEIEDDAAPRVLALHDEARRVR